MQLFRTAFTAYMKRHELRITRGILNFDFVTLSVIIRLAFRVRAFHAMPIIGFMRIVKRNNCDYEMILWG